MSVIDLAQRRVPVWYTVRLGHHWDDTLEIVVEDVADNGRSRLSVADALRRAADALDSSATPPPSPKAPEPAEPV